MSDTGRGERLQIMLTPEELEALDTWRFGRRMPSRAAAVRELLKRGLADETRKPEGRTRSQDFGVIEEQDDEAPATPQAANNGRARRADGSGK